jgi:hypothetical protein
MDLHTPVYEAPRALLLHSNDVHGGNKLPISLLMAAINAFRTRAEDTFRPSLDVSIFVLNSHNELCAATAPASAQVCPEVRHITGKFQGCPVACERLLHRVVPALKAHTRPPSTSSSALVRIAVLYAHGLLRSDALGEYSVRCTRKRTLFHSIMDLWTTMLSMIKREPEGLSRLGNTSIKFRSIYVSFM